MHHWVVDEVPWKEMANQSLDHPQALGALNLLVVMWSHLFLQPMVHRYLMVIVKNGHQTGVRHWLFGFGLRALPCFGLAGALKASLPPGEYWDIPTILVVAGLVLFVLETMKLGGTWDLIQPLPQPHVLVSGVLFLLGVESMKHVVT